MACAAVSASTPIAPFHSGELKHLASITARARKRYLLRGNLACPGQESLLQLGEFGRESFHFGDVGRLQLEAVLQQTTRLLCVAVRLFQLTHDLAQVADMFAIEA